MMKNVYTEFGDGTLVTYNDIQMGKNGEHIPLYFEKPVDGGFAFLETSLPDLSVIASGGYTDSEKKELMKFALCNAPPDLGTGQGGKSYYPHCLKYSVISFISGQVMAMNRLTSILQKEYHGKTIRKSG